MISGDNTSLITTLNISSATPSDVGLYECRASINKNNQIKNAAHFCPQGLINERFEINLTFH